VTIGGEKCVTERERRKLDATVTVGGQGVGKKGRGKGIRFLPTVTIGGEKCVTEREEQKLDATVTVGGQRIGKKGGGKA
jgi:ribosome-associated toxin RatA of RatAB toxin-antitoxin module